MNICEKAANASTIFEKNNTELKKQYIIKNIEMINHIMERMPGYCGSFGTGYPFYTLDNGMQGNLPVIQEQIRYNDELVKEAADYDVWPCEDCLKEKGATMPDLKQICKPCPRVKDSVKPRKVVNRLPDIDMWMICEDTQVEMAKKKMIEVFNAFDMHTSDIDPVGTVNKVSEIANKIEKGEMPKIYLPLDVHIIEYSKMAGLLESVPFTLLGVAENDNVPYLPIHPTSLRKTWQHDDMAYNFILDYLYSLTPFNWTPSLMQKLQDSRTLINKSFTEEDLKEMLGRVAPDSVKRRFETPELKKSYERRINKWTK